MGDAPAARNLFAARALRDFGDGFAAILLPAYLRAVGASDFEIGVVASAALFGSALITLAVGGLGWRYDRRHLLIAGAGLMAATGIGLALFDALLPILLIAFAGTINPASGSASVLVPLEHAVLSTAAGDAGRTGAFARYSLVGALSAAAGALAVAVPDQLVRLGAGRTEAIRWMFWGYAALGIGAALLYMRLPSQRPPADQPATAALGPSRGIVYRLAALFALDAFAGGFAVQSLLALWLFGAFGLSLSAASVFFFCASLISAASFPVAARISRRIGLVNTMVFTHIPSSVFLILAALAPSLPLALAFLLLRAGLSQMDVPARSSYVMAVVSAAERPAAASFTAVPRSLAAAASPALAGALLTAHEQALPFIACGALKILYDLLLLVQFRQVRPPEER
ncbi:MAG: MFS transporter [Bauldia sp.]